MVRDGVSAALDEGQDQGSVAGQGHVEEGYRSDLGTMGERQLNDSRRSMNSAFAEEVVLDLLTRLVAQEQLDQAVESGLQSDTEKSRPDLPRDVKRAAGANPGLDLVQPPSWTEPDQLLASKTDNTSAMSLGRATAPVTSLPRRLPRRDSADPEQSRPPMRVAPQRGELRRDPCLHQVVELARLVEDLVRLGIGSHVRPGVVDDVTFSPAGLEVVRTASPPSRGPG